MGVKAGRKITATMATIGAMIITLCPLNARYTSRNSARNKPATLMVVVINPPSYTRFIIAAATAF